MTRAPIRIQRSRAKGWKMPEGAVYVGRPTKWGNPFKWTEFYHPGWNTPADAVAEAVDWFSDALRDGHCPIEPHPEWIARMAREAPIELRGKDLACWCPLDQPCHADALLRIANA